MPSRCGEWLERFDAARAKIVKLYDERFFRMWEFYLAGGIVMFESGAACNFQVQYVRDRNALPITRDYMFETEQRYREIAAEPAAVEEAAQCRAEEGAGNDQRLTPEPLRRACAQSASAGATGGVLRGSACRRG